MNSLEICFAEYSRTCNGKLTSVPLKQCKESTVVIFLFLFHLSQTNKSNYFTKKCQRVIECSHQGSWRLHFFCRCWAQVLSSISSLWLDNTCPREESKDKLTWESVRRVHEQHLHSRAGPIHCHKKRKKTRLHHVCSWVFPVTSWQAVMEGKDGCLLGL